MVTEALVHNETFPGYGGGKPVADAAVIVEREGDKRCTFHIDHELTVAMALLSRAEATLDDDDDRPPVPELDWTRAPYANGYFRINGRPVFAGGFNFFGVNGPAGDALLQKTK